MPTVIDQVQFHRLITTYVRLVTLFKEKHRGEPAGIQKTQILEQALRLCAIRNPKRAKPYRKALLEWRSAANPQYELLMTRQT